MISILVMIRVYVNNLGELFNCVFEIFIVLVFLNVGFFVVIYGLVLCLKFYF